tara:strand:+ start:1029 stop:1283 length:255 start_codon:yes stop_codon:yes gene_type:complete
MSWENILKDEESYEHLLVLIGKVEESIERFHDDVESAAQELHENTGLPIEKAREIIKGLQKDTLKMLEDTLDEFRKELPNHISR